MSDRKYEQARIAAGMCRNCGCRKSKPDCSSCARCLQEKGKTQADLRQEREERGVCKKCGLRKPIKGRKMCRACLGKHRETNRRYRARRQATA